MDERTRIGRTEHEETSVRAQAARGQDGILAQLEELQREHEAMRAALTDLVRSSDRLTRDRGFDFGHALARARSYVLP